MQQVRLENELEKGNTGQTHSSFETLKILNFLDSYRSMAFLDKQRNICIAKINEKLFIKLISFFLKDIFKENNKTFSFL